MSPIFLTYNNRAHTDGAGAHSIASTGSIASRANSALATSIRRSGGSIIRAFRLCERSFTDTLADQFNALCTHPLGRGLAGRSESSTAGSSTGLRDRTEGAGARSPAPLVVRITHPHPVSIPIRIRRAVSDVAPLQVRHIAGWKATASRGVHIRRGRHPCSRAERHPEQLLLGVIHRCAAPCKRQAYTSDRGHSERRRIHGRESDRGTYNLTEDFQFEPEDDAFRRDREHQRAAPALR